MPSTTNHNVTSDLGFDRDFVPWKKLEEELARHERPITNCSKLSQSNNTISDYSESPQ